MPSAKFRCPECETAFRLDAEPPAGKRIRCPKCEARFRPDESADDAQERPASRPKARKKAAATTGNGGLILSLALGGGALLLVIVGVVVGVLFWKNAGPSSGPERSVWLHTQVADTLATVRDNATAESARPHLVSLGQQVNQFNHRRGRVEDFHEHNPQKLTVSPDMIQQLINATLRVTEETERVAKVDGGKEVLRAYYEASGEPAPFHLDLRGEMTEVMREQIERGRRFEQEMAAKEKARQSQEAKNNPMPMTPAVPDPAKPAPIAGTIDPNRATPENYARIQNNMTVEEVVNLLGPPSRISTGKRSIAGKTIQITRTLIYRTPNLNASILTVNDRVMSRTSSNKGP